ncbi:MAG: ice-binding family protein, partial [Sulfuricaulis sp.]|nr:ice-binding family protein [Sulfuricaulis sp.]
WSVVNGGGTVPSGATGTTVVFTAGTTAGTFSNTVRAVEGTLADSSTVIVTLGPLATLVVTPETTTLAQGGTQTFTAVGRDAGGNVVTINPSWSVVNGGGTVPSGATGTTVVFTAGTTAGTFSNTVRAAEGTLADSSTVIVEALPPPLPAAGVRMIARVAWTCTNGSITGSVATNQTGTEVPPGSVTQTLCPISGTTEIGTAAAKQAYSDFLVAYSADSAAVCGTTLTGTLAGQILAPGVYCFDNAATLTGTLTLSGPSDGQWLFKVGAAGIPGALAGTSFDVVMAGGASACNVQWWVLQASAMTDSNFQGHILAGAGISFTRGTYKGNAWSKEDVTVTGAPGTPAPVVACDGTLP